MATRAPFTVTDAVGGPHLALATVGALTPNHPQIQSWNPFARNNTRFRNIILVGHDIDAEYKFLGTNPLFPHLNIFSFATVGAIFDCQRLYMMLHPATYGNKISLENLIRYCFPDVDVETLVLHNAGNDSYWELKCAMVLLTKLAEQYAPGSATRQAYAKLWDAIFVCVDVEAWNGHQRRLTELGFSWLDSRQISNIHRLDFDDKIRASHIIIKGAVPRKNEEGVRVWKGVKHGKGNNETDLFYPRFGSSKEIWPNQIPSRANRLFFIDARSAPYKWLAPADLESNDQGSCVLTQHVTGPLVRSP